MDIVNLEDVKMESHSDSGVRVYPDYYLAVMVGAIKEKDIPANARIVNANTFKNFKDRGKPKDKPVPQNDRVSHKDKMANSDKPHPTPNVVL